MDKYQSLTAEEVLETASAYFKERQTKAVKQVQPIIVLVGGQPGAGKSAAAARVKAELAGQGGYIHVDADRMRERIRVGDNKPTSDQTQADAGRLVTTLRNQALEGQRHIVEEGTFRNPDGAGKFVQGLQERGYQVELFAVATPLEESLLGIYQRHELQHAAGAANPRFVSKVYHDEAAQGFESTLARTVAQLNRVRIADRAGAVLYDSAVQTNVSANALEALKLGRRLIGSKLVQVMRAWGDVQAIAKQRNAPDAYLDGIGNHIKRLTEKENSAQSGYGLER